MNKNITLDFTAEKAVDGAIAGQPLAIMPAELAKKLLKAYAKKLVSASPRDIISPIIDELKRIVNIDDGNTNRVNEAVIACAQFIQERTLIDNCAKENWDAFAVENLDAMKA